MAESKVNVSLRRDVSQHVLLSKKKKGSIKHKKKIKFKCGPKDYSVEEFFELYADKLPQLVMVTKGSTRNSVSPQTIADKQIMYIAAISKSTRLMTILVSPRGEKMISIPECYAEKFCLLENDKCHAERFLFEIWRRHGTPFKAQFPKNKTLSHGGARISTNDIPPLTFLETFDEIHLLCNLVNNAYKITVADSKWFVGEFCPEVVCIPLFNGILRMCPVVGTCHKQKSLWSAFAEELGRLSSQVEYHCQYGNVNIAEYRLNKSISETKFSCLRPKAYVNITSLLLSLSPGGQCVDKSASDLEDTDVGAYAEIDEWPDFCISQIFEKNREGPFSFINETMNTEEEDDAYEFISPRIISAIAEQAPENVRLKSTTPCKPLTTAQTTFKIDEKETVGKSVVRLVMSFERKSGSEKSNTIEEPIKENQQKSSLATSGDKADEYYFKKVKDLAKKFEVTHFNLDLDQQAEPQPGLISMNDTNVNRDDGLLNDSSIDSDDYLNEHEIAAMKARERRKCVVDSNTASLNENVALLHTTTAKSREDKLNDTCVMKRLKKPLNNNSTNLYLNEIPRSTIYPTFIREKRKDETHSSTTGQIPESPSKHVSDPQYSKRENSTENAWLRPVRTKDDVALLTVTEVCKYLERLNLSNYVERFRDQQVDGALLVDLEKDMFKEEFGLTNIEAMRLHKFATDGHVPVI